MKEKKIKCESCHLRGYNLEYCRWHKKVLLGSDIGYCHADDFYKKLGKTAVIGAGIGLVSATVGVAAAPALGLKAFVGHALAAKLTGGGGGAAIGGIKAWRKSHEKRRMPTGTERKKVLLPFYLLSTQSKFAGS